MIRFIFLAILCMVSAASAATVNIAAGASVQSAINSGCAGPCPPGTTYILAPGTYRQQSFIPQAGDQFICDPQGGTVFDGERNVLEAMHFNVAVPGILFRSCVFTGYGYVAGVSAPECITGAVTGANGWFFYDVQFINNGCTGLQAGGGTVIVGGKADNNGHAGVKCFGPSINISGMEIAGNNWKKDSGSNDAAGLKCTGMSFGVFNNLNVHDNLGNGLWFDISANNILVENSTVVRNTSPNGGGVGIDCEISVGCLIINNTVQDNDFCQICLFNTIGAQVWGNIVRSSASGSFGILLQTISRSDNIGSTDLNVIGKQGKPNIITALAPPSIPPGAGSGARYYGGSVGTGNLFDYNTYLEGDFYQPNNPYGLQFRSHYFHCVSVTDCPTGGNPVPFSVYQGTWDAHSTMGPAQ
jgi:parallel beta helix pectate lyase-like protein